MDTKTQLKRFCFLGSFEPVYTHLSGTLNVKKYWPIVEKLVVAINDIEFLPLMREVLHEVALVRRDEALFVYAAYLAAKVEIEFKTAMRQAFPVLIRTDEDLFLFCKYASLIGEQKNQKCFSRTVRKALTAFYEMQTPDAIRTMWLAHRGLHGYTHKILIKLCHITDETMGASDVASPFFMTCTILLKEAEAKQAFINANLPGVVLPTSASVSASVAKDSNVNATSTQTVDLQSQAIEEQFAKALQIKTDALSNVQPQQSADKSTNIVNANTMQIKTEAPSNVQPQQSADKSTVNANAMLIKTEAPSNVQPQQSADKSTNTTSPEPTKVSALVAAISKLRTTKKKNEAIKIVRKYKLSYSQVPGHWQRDPVIMETCLHSMSYLQILKSWRKMVRNNNFEQSPKMFKLCKRLLENKDFAKKCRVHPIHLLMSLKDMGSLDKLPPKKVEALKLDYLTKLYKDSFHWHPDSGNLRMHITVNLQTNYKKKFLKNHKKLNYYDACQALAFGYAKREAKVDVFHWYEDKIKLKKIVFEKSYTTQMGFNSYDLVENHKNNQRLVTPIMNALTSEQVYDVFLCIVPTAGRGNPKQKSEFLCMFLDKYRECKNSNARFIILNLLKFKRSMQYSELRTENILEICGLDEHTTDIIHNFATHRFY